jgi:hypothetical protein
MVRLSHELRAGKSGSPADQQLAFQDDAQWLTAFPDVGATLLASAANRWAGAAQLQPSIRNLNAAPVVRFESLRRNGQLFGALVLQLLHRLTGPQEQVLCSACGEPYELKKRLPAASKANYCGKCGRPEAVRRAKERLRSRKRKAMSLAASGESPEQIASSTGSRLKTVKRWLKRAKKRARPRRSGRGK